jgi:DNA-binding transcriptional LysR family regulator
MFDSDLLENFLHIIDHGGFTAAAKSTYATQSTVSAKLARLEAQAGHRLMARNRRGVIALTREGREVESLARETRRMHALARRRLDEQPLSGTVKLGMSDDIASAGNYPRVLAEFRREQPAVQLEVIVGAGPALQRDLEQGEIDHLLCKVSGELPAGAVELWREDLCWFGRLDASTSDADALELVTFTPPCAYRTRAISVLTQQGMRWRGVYVTPSLNGVLAAVEAGLGVSLLPKSLASDAMTRIPPGRLPAAGRIAFAVLSRSDIADRANTVFRAMLEQLLPPLVR